MSDLFSQQQTPTGVPNLSNPNPLVLPPPPSFAPVPATPPVAPKPAPVAPTQPVQTAKPVAPSSVPTPKVLPMNVDGVHYDVQWKRATPPNATDFQKINTAIRSTPDHHQKAFVAPKDPDTENAIQSYTKQWLSNPDDQSVPNILLHKLVNTPLANRYDALPPALSPVGKMALMRAAYNAAGAGTGSISAEPKPGKPNIAQKALGAVQSGIAYTAAPIKAAIQPAQVAIRNATQDWGTNTQTPADKAEQERVAKLPFLQRMQTVKNQDVRTMAQPDLTASRSMEDEAQPFVARTMGNIGKMAGSMAIDPLTWALGAGLIAKAPAVGRAVSGTFAAESLAPYIANPKKLLTDDPAETLVNVPMGVLMAAHALHSPIAVASQASAVPESQPAPVTPQSPIQIGDTLKLPNGSSMTVHGVTPDSVKVSAPEAATAFANHANTEATAASQPATAPLNKNAKPTANAPTTPVEAAKPAQATDNAQPAPVKPAEAQPIAVGQKVMGLVKSEDGTSSWVPVELGNVNTDHGIANGVDEQGQHHFFTMKELQPMNAVGNTTPRPQEATGAGQATGTGTQGEVTSGKPTVVPTVQGQGEVGTKQEVPNGQANAQAPVTPTQDIFSDLTLAQKQALLRTQLAHGGIAQEGLRESIAAHQSANEPAVQGQGEVGTKQEVPNGQANAQAPVTPIKGEMIGAKGTTLTPDNTKVPFHYAVVPADSLVTSHTDTFSENPAYDQSLQPRDRSRMASESQVVQMAQTLKPERLTSAPTTADGAPIVGSDGQVESGNGRTMAIRRAYSQNLPTAADYATHIADNAEQFGLTRDQVTGTENPVLVRVNETPFASPEERANFAAEAGRSTVAAMSPVEIASADAKAMRDSGALALHEPNSAISSSKNQPFVAKFMQSVSPTERATMMQPDGSLSAQGADRINNAILRSAYDDPTTIERLIGNPDPDTKNVGRALETVASRVANAKQAMDSGSMHPMDISKDITDAANTFSQMKRNGISLAEHNAQLSMFDENPLSPVASDMLRILDENTRSASRIAQIIDAYHRIVEGYGDPRQAENGLVAGKKILSVRNALAVAENEVLERNGKGKQSGFDFADEPNPDRQNVASEPAERGVPTGENATETVVPEESAKGETEPSAPAQPSQELRTGSEEATGNAGEPTAARPASGERNPGSVETAHVNPEWERQILQTHDKVAENKMGALYRSKTDPSKGAYYRVDDKPYKGNFDTMQKYLANGGPPTRGGTRAKPATTPTVEPAQSETTQTLREAEPANTAPSAEQVQASNQANKVEQEKTAASGVPEGTPVAPTTAGEEAKPSEATSGGGGGNPKPEGVLTGGKNAITEWERAQEGRPEVDRQAYTTIRQAAELGREAVENSTPGDRNDPRKLAEEVAARPRVLSAEEVGKLVYDRARIINESEANRKAMMSETDPAKLSEMGSEQERIDHAFDMNDQALVKGGREQSAAFNARKMMLKPDYTLAESKQLWKARNGGAEVPKDVSDKLTDLYRQLDEAKARAETAEQRAKDLEAQKGVAKAAIEARSAGRGLKREALQKEMNDLKDQLYSALNLDKPKSGSGKVNMSIDPTKGRYDEADLKKIVPILGKMARNLAQQGIVKADEIVDSIHTQLQDTGLTRREVRDAISGYGKVSNRTTSPETTALNNAKTVMRLASAYEDALKGIAPKKGNAPGKPSAEAVALKKLLDNELTKQGLNPDGTKILEAKQSAELNRVQKQIADLKAKRDGVVKTVTAKSPVPETPEIKAARAERDALQKEIMAARKAAADASKPKPLTPEERQAKVTANRQAALEKQLVKSIGDLQRQIDAGGAKPAAKSGTPVPDTPRTTALKQMQSKLRTQLDTLRNPPMTDAQKQAKETASKQSAQKTNLENQIKALDAKIASKDTTGTTRTAVPTTPEIEALKAERAAKQAAYNALPEVQAKAAADQQASTLAAKQKRLDTLNAKIASGDFSKPAKPTPVTSPAIEALNKQIEAAQAQFDKMKPPTERTPLTDEQRLTALKRSQQVRIDQLEKQLATGEKPTPRPPVAMDAEARANQQRIASIKDQIDLLIKPKPGFLDNLVALRRAGFLISPRTHVKIALQHGALFAAHEASMPFAALADIARAGLTGSDRTVGGASLTGINKALQMVRSQGFEGAKTILKYGEGALHHEQAANMQPDNPYGQMSKTFGSKGDVTASRGEFNSNSRIINGFVNGPSRTHGAMYHLMQTYALARSIYEQASVAAINDARHGDISRGEIAERTQHYFDNPTTMMSIRAIDNARRMTLQNDNALASGIGGAKKALSQMVKDENGNMVPKLAGGKAASAAIDLALPFPKVQTNAAAQAVEFTGLPAVGNTAKLALDMLRGSKVPDAQAIRWAQTVGKLPVGVGLMAAGYGAYWMHKVNGTLANQKERKENAVTGKIPGAVNALGREWDLSNFGTPISNFLWGASLAQSEDSHNQDALHGKQKALRLGEATGHLIADQPLMALGETYDKAKEQGVGTALLGELATFVPGGNLTSDVAAQFDPVRRDTSGSISAPFMNRVPGLREMLPPIMNERGQGVPERAGLIDPFRSARPGGVPLSSEDRAKAIERMREKAREKAGSR